MRFEKILKIRRVVTGHNKNGQSVVKWDNGIEDVTGRKGFSYVPLWATKELPVKFTDEDPNSWQIGTSIATGSVFRIIKYEPGVAKRWHKTDSIDFAVVLSGEIYMQLDECEVCLKEGDVLIQRGTIHNWENRGKQPCIIAFVLIATEGGKSTGWD
jgi:quercetin dioxygenase-like cupin family protein